MAQFRLRVTDSQTVPLEVYDESLEVTALATGPDGYFSRALPPGGRQFLTLKRTIPLANSETGWTSTVFLRSADDQFIDAIGATTEREAPSGTTAYDLLARAGTQKYVGAGQNGQTSTSGTIAASGTAKFTATLQNNSAARAAISFSISDSLGCEVTLRVKQGLTNITAAARAGTYHTPRSRQGSRGF